MIPYISHLLATAALVLEAGGNETHAIAAVLHDAVEDAGGRRTLREIRRRFGPKVARIVEGCTDSYTTPKPPWRKRKEEYIRHLTKAPQEVLLISAADKLHNARAIVCDYRQYGKKLWRRFNGGRAGTLWYYSRLGAILKRRMPRSTTAQELARVVAELRRIAHSRRARR